MSDQEKGQGEKGEKPGKKGHTPNPNQKHCPKCGEFMKLSDLHSACQVCRVKRGVNGNCDGETEACTECAAWTPEQREAFSISIKKKEAKGHKRKSPKESPSVWQAARQLALDNAPPRTKAAMKELPDAAFSLGPPSASHTLSSEAQAGFQAQAEVQAKLQPVPVSSAAIRKLGFPTPTGVHGQADAAPKGPPHGGFMPPGLWPAQGSMWMHPSSGQYFPYDQAMMPPPPQPADQTTALTKMTETVIKLVENLPQQMADQQRQLLAHIGRPTPTAAAGAPPPPVVIPVLDSDEELPEITIKKEPVDTPTVAPRFQQAQPESDSDRESSSEEGTDQEDSRSEQDVPLEPHTETSDGDGATPEAQRQMHHALLTAFKVLENKDTVDPEHVSMAPLREKASAATVQAFTKDLLSHAYDWPTHSHTKTSKSGVPRPESTKESTSHLPPSAVMSEQFFLANATLRGWSDERTDRKLKQLEAEDKTGLCPTPSGMFLWSKDDVINKDTKAKGKYLKVEKKLWSSTPDYPMEAVSTKDKLLHQFSNVVDAKMPKTVEVPTEELLALLGTFKTFMVLLSRGHWVDSAIHKVLSSLPTTEDGAQISQNLLDVLKAMIVDHSIDHETLSRHTATSSANIALLLRDQAITALKEAKGHPTGTSSRQPTVNPLAYLGPTDWTKLRTSQVFAQGLFEQKQVDSLLRQVQDQVQSAQQMTTVVAAATRSSAGKSYATSGSSTSKRKSSSKSEKSKAKRARTEPEVASRVSPRTHRPFQPPAGFQAPNQHYKGGQSRSKQRPGKGRGRGKPNK